MFLLALPLAIVAFALVGALLPAPATAEPFAVAGSTSRDSPSSP
jgi:hypothetical protein